MARLIDADKLLEKLAKMIEYCKKDNGVNGLTALFQAGDAIMDCKAVDAVPVVRCKDCKYFQYGDYCIEDKMEHSHCHEDDYCSYGERRGEADD